MSIIVQDQGRHNSGIKSVPVCLSDQPGDIIVRESPAIVGCEIWFCPLLTVPLLRTAPRVMRSSVEMTGMTALPCGMRATLEKRKMAASKLWKKVLAPAKKKLPAGSIRL